MFPKLIISLLVAFCAPLLFLIIFRSRLPGWSITAFVLYLLICSAVAYPVGLFAYMLNEIPDKMDSDCHKTISTIHRFQGLRISRSYDEQLLHVVFELKPYVYVNAALATCEYKLRNFKIAQHAVDNLSVMDDRELAKHMNFEAYKTLRRKIRDAASE